MNIHVFRGPILKENTVVISNGDQYGAVPCERRRSFGDDEDVVQ